MSGVEHLQCCVFDLTLFDYIMMMLMIIGIEYEPVLFFEEPAAIELESNKARSLIIIVIIVFQLLQSADSKLYINLVYYHMCFCWKSIRQ